MSLMSGLEKYGIKADQINMDNLFERDPNARKQDQTENQAIEWTEDDFLFDKTIECAVCQKSFPVRAVKNSKLRRLTPDSDLRPRFSYIDTLKYEVYSCPFCGYTAMTRYFDHISSMQRKLILQDVASKFMEGDNLMDSLDLMDSRYTYDMALERYKLSLYNTIVKKGQISEKAYTCLKISWLLRGKCEELIEEGEREDSETVQTVREEEQAFYEQAYEGFIKATSSEMFPICGMDQNTMDILLAEMAFKLKKYDAASRYVSGILISQTANRSTKDKAYRLKEEIVKKLRK